MNKVKREEILDYVTYDEQRNEIRAAALEQKKPRRIHLGDYLTFLFENHDTIRYQVLEMVRVERIVKEADIQHELDTYNELLGGPGQLGCSLLIEIETEEERNVKLTQWLPLMQHLYLETDDGTRVRPVYDERQVGDTRLSSVQYLKFDCGGRKPVALGSDFNLLECRVELTEVQKTALNQDIADAG